MQQSIRQRKTLKRKIRQSVWPQAWYWFVISGPALGLWIWGNDSQAADILIEFETAVAPAPLAFSSPPEPWDGREPPDAYLLSFKPPQLAADRLRSQSNGVSSTTSQPPSEADDKFPLPIPEGLPPTEFKAAAELPPPSLVPDVAELFTGGANSLVAHAVGSAEGTRTPDGKKTLAYYGHVDPGNQAWNQGTFSYQHGASSPEEADGKQLARLQRQTMELHRLAAARGLTLTPEEILNGIDLANQAPIAALDRGYIDWLSEAKKIGLERQEAILWARTRSFLDPDTGRWNAPGLGNSVYSITQDQARRQQAIAAAMVVSSQSQDRQRSQPTQVSTKSPTKASNST